jgi:hypothetical protein
MMTITASQHRNARRPCRSSTGHSVAYSDRQFGPQWTSHLPIDAAPFNRDDPLDHRGGLDQCAQPTRHNSVTAAAAAKSP